MRRGLTVVVMALFVASCRGAEPLISFLDDETGLSFTHAQRWNVGFAEQGGIRYRYLTAPKVEGDTEALSVTFIAPTEATSADSVAAAYLTGASGVVAAPGSPSSNWTFKDSSGAPSRLRLNSLPGGRFFGAWVRGSEKAFNRYSGRIDDLFASLRVETAAEWPEEKFAGMVVRAPASWIRGSRLSSATHASMQFKSPPLFVEKGASTIHGFVTVAKEPAAPGDLEAFNKMIKDRASDTVALLEHKVWPPSADGLRAQGYVDYLRSGNAMTTTRMRRFITIRNGVGLTLTCEARADAFDRLDPWCRRLADSVRLE